ncbi:MAG: methyltransferase domain-containing protein [Gemmataceae bacterium]|nr:methyltransferase domain-containing protein [Gemmataceae bacterium]
MPRPARFARRLLPVAALLALLGVGWWVAFRELASYRTPDVPFVTTPPEVVEAMLDAAAVRDGDVVYDLGCGDGRLVIGAARRSAGVKGVGIDIDPDRVAEARAAAEVAGVADRVTFRRADLFDEDFRPATVVLMYLMTTVNERLVPQFDRMRPGTRIVSHHFRIPGIKPAEKRMIPADGLEHPVFVYVTPLERE